MPADILGGMSVLRPLERRVVLRTFVSRAYWCSPSKGYMFEHASLEPGMHSNPTSTAWLDVLLDGGVVVPQADAKHPRSLSILVAGTPGCGKSTLVAELCWRWCTEVMPEWGQLLNASQKKPRILYITSESSLSLMVNNAMSYGWGRNLSDENQKPDKVFVEFTKGQPLETGKISVLTALTAKQLLDGIWESPPGSNSESFPGIFRPLPHADVVVIDSLNVISSGDNVGQKLERAYAWLTNQGAKIVIMVADSSRSRAVSDHWDFAADLVIRLNRRAENVGHIGYLLREIEIVKARYQKHAWGSHQLKIQEGMKASEAQRTLDPQTAAGQPGIPEGAKASEAQKVSDTQAITDEERALRKRAHPYRERGGVFIFPSMHFILSRYKHDSSDMNPHRKTGFQHLQSGVEGLGEILEEGYPRGRCTALVGCRGGHKSHLAFQEALFRLQHSSEEVEHRALIVSLRDDEHVTRSTLEKIQAGLTGNQSSAGADLKHLEEQDRLDITFYPPGYITPEEFFHRLLLSIKRMKENDPKRHVTLVFNSVEQLSSRFPLCTKEPIFIPGIIQMLVSEDVTSFFVSAAPEDDRTELYGLETLAELILRFERHNIGENRYSMVAKRLGREWPKTMTSDFFPRQVAKITVDRFAGGKAAGAHGYLDLYSKRDQQEEIPPLTKGSLNPNCLVFFKGVSIPMNRTLFPRRRAHPNNAIK